MNLKTLENLQNLFWYIEQWKNLPDDICVNNDNAPVDKPETKALGPESKPLYGR